MSGHHRLLGFPGVRRQVVAACVSRMTQPLLTLPLLVGIDQVYEDHALAALMVGLYTVAFATMMPVTGRLVDRHGGRVVLRVRLGLALTALLATGAALSLRAPVLTLAVSCRPGSLPSSGRGGDTRRMARPGAFGPAPSGVRVGLRHQ